MTSGNCLMVSPNSATLLRPLRGQFNVRKHHRIKAQFFTIKHQALCLDQAGSNHRAAVYAANKVIETDQPARRSRWQKDLHPTAASGESCDPIRLFQFFALFIPFYGYY